MKRIVALALAVIMMLSISVTPAFAVPETVELAVTADKTELKAGETVVFTVKSVKAIDNLGALQFTLDFGSNFENVSYVDTLTGWTPLSTAGETFTYSGYAVDGISVAAGTTLLTVTERVVQNPALGNITITPKNIACGNNTGAPYTVTPAAASVTVYKELTGTLNIIDLDVPAVGAVPDTAVTAPTGTTVVGVSWIGDPLTTGGKFEENSNYTVRIVLAPADNCRFADDVPFTINGENAITAVDPADSANRVVKYGFTTPDKPENTVQLATPTVADKKGGDITIAAPTQVGGSAIPAGETVEYGTSTDISKLPTAWSTVDAFTANPFAPGEYYIFSRVQETDTHKAGAAVVSDKVTVFAAPTLSYTAPTSLTVGTDITAMAPTVTGGAEPYSYAIADGSTLPIGLYFDEDSGIITQAPCEASSSAATVTIEVTDGEGVSASYQVIFPAVAKGDCTVSAPTLKIKEAGSLYVEVTNPVPRQMYMCLKSADPAPTPDTSGWTEYTDPNDSFLFPVLNYPPNVSYTVYTYAPADENFNVSPVESASISTPKMAIYERSTEPFRITGDAVWGSTLTADVERIRPEEAHADLTYQWLRGYDSATAAPITGATGTDYTLTVYDIGSKIWVQVFANGDYEGTKAAGTAARVEKADQTTVAPVVSAFTDTTIIVTAQTGHFYMVKPAEETAPTAASTGWQSGGAFGGLSPNTAYKVYAYIPGTATHEAGVVESVAQTTAKTALTGTVTIKRGGAAVTTPAYGDELTADAPTGVPYTYQWYRGEAPITGANSASYTATATDIGQTLKVVVGAVADSDYTGTLTSPATNAVTKASQTATVPDIYMHTDDAIEVNTETGHLYQCVASGTDAPTAASTGWDSLQTGALNTFAGLHPNTAYKVYAYLPETATHSASAVVYTAVTTDKIEIWGNPTYTEPPVYGATLDAYVDKIYPGAARDYLDYQWLRDGEAIDGETGTSYTLTTADVGHRVTVKVTAKADSDYTGDKAGGLGGDDNLVAKATYSTAVKADFNVYYGDATAHSFTTAAFALPSDIENARASSITANHGSFEILDVAGLTGFQLKSGLPEADVGKTDSYSVKVSSKNYNDITVTINVTAVNKTELTISPSMTKNTYTYGDIVDKASCSVAPSAGGALTQEEAETLPESLVYTYAGTPDDGSAFTAGATAPTKAGDYTLTASVPDTNAKYMGTKTIHFTIEPKEVTAVRATAEAITKEYNGYVSAQDISFTAQGVNGETLSITATGNQYMSGNELLSDVGRNLTIKLGAKTGENANYVVTYPAVTGDITPKSVTATLSSPTSITKEYDGTTSVGALTYSFAGVGETVTVTITGSTYDNKNAGMGKAVTLGTKTPSCNPVNYDIAYAPVTGSITPKSVDVTINGVDAAGYDPTATAANYTPHTASYPTCAGDTVSATVWYTPEGSTTFPEAGEYWVHATVTDANYSKVNEGGTLYFTIDKLNITTLADKVVFQRVGVTAAQTYAVADFGTTPCEGTWSVRGCSTGFVGTPSYANGVISYQVDARVTAGNRVVLWMKFTPTKNYEEKVVMLSIQIIAKNPATVSVSQDDWYYGSLASDVTKSVIITDTDAKTNADWTYSYEGALSNGTAYGPTNTVPTDPGAYTVTACYEDDNHKGQNTDSFTINKRPLTYNTGTGVTVKTKEFDNRTAAEITGTLAYVGVVSGDTVAAPTVVSAAFRDAAVGTQKSVTVTVSALAGADAWKYTASTTTALTGAITPATKPVLMSNDDTLRINSVPADVGNMSAQIQASYTDVAAVKKAAETTAKATLSGVTGSELYDVRLQENGAGGWADVNNRPVPLFFPLRTNMTNAQVMLVRVNDNGTMTPVGGVTKTAQGLSVTTNTGVFAMVWYEPATGNDGYTVLEGANGVFDGKSAVKFCINHTDTELLNVYLTKDGAQKLLTKGKDYTVKSGSTTTITLTSSCVKKMGDGGYMLYAAYKNGYASTYFNLYAGNKAGVSSADTGDMGVTLYAMMALSGAAGAVWVGRKKKEDR